jgi:hypothetical protein
MPQSLSSSELVAASLAPCRPLICQPFKPTVPQPRIPSCKGRASVLTLEAAATAAGYGHWAALVFGDLHDTWLPPAHIAAIVRGEPLSASHSSNTLGADASSVGPSGGSGQTRLLDESIVPGVTADWQAWRWLVTQLLARDCKGVWPNFSHSNAEHHQFIARLTAFLALRANWWEPCLCLGQLNRHSIAKGV